MAKTAPLKKKGATSVHSRAAKRASSPGIDLDKSLKDLKPPTEVKKSRPSVLAVHQGAGVSKKSKNGRKSVLSAKAKRRQEKGLDRAEAVMDKKEKKVEKSKDRARTVQERSKDWELLNKKMLAEKAKDDAEALERAEALALEQETLDGALDDVEMLKEPASDEVPASEAMETENLAPSIPLPPPEENEEEVL